MNAKDFGQFLHTIVYRLSLFSNMNAKDFGQFLRHNVHRIDSKCPLFQTHVHCNRTLQRDFELGRPVSYGFGYLLVMGFCSFDVAIMM